MEQEIEEKKERKRSKRNRRKRNNISNKDRYRSVLEYSIHAREVEKKYRLKYPKKNHDIPLF